MGEFSRSLEFTWTVAATSPKDIYYVSYYVSGDNVLDREDRENLTDQELEHFWTVDRNFRRYKEQHQAKVFHLQPGARRAYPSEPSALDEETPTMSRCHYA
jgi:hypothetical protein